MTKRRTKHNRISKRLGRKAFRAKERAALRGDHVRNTAHLARAWGGGSLKGRFLP